MNMASNLVMNNPEMMRIILDFYGVNSYLYTGILSKMHHSISTKKTSKHYVAESRRRISRQIWKKEGFKFITECMASSARHGDLRALKRIDMYSRRCNLRILSSRDRNPMDSAAASGHLPTIVWMHSKKFSMGRRTMLEAAKAPNRAENIQWLIDNKCEFDESAEIELARRGDVRALEVLRSRKGVKGFSTNVLLRAVESDMRQDSCVVHYLINDGCPLKTTVICVAASVGDLVSVKLLRQHGSDWDERVCWLAALNGHLEIIKWVRSCNPPCPWNELSLRVAVFRKDLEIIKFCVENGCPGAEKILN